MQVTTNFDCNSFYDQRDHRTNLTLPQSAAPVPLAISIAPAYAQTIDGQLTLYWLSSLVSRMGRRYNQLKLLLPPEIADFGCKLPGFHDSSLAQVIMNHLRAADPCGNYEVIDRFSEALGVISVGDLENGSDHIVVQPQGWSAAIAPPGVLSNISGDIPSSNPIGAALAASLGAAEIYFRCNQDKLTSRQSQLPLWISARQSATTRSAEEAAAWHDNLPLPDPLDIGRCLVIGAGALGGNLLAILAANREGLRGHIDVVDSDLIDFTSLNRLLAALVEHRGTGKVDLVSLMFQGSATQVIPHRKSYESLDLRNASGLTIEDYDIVLTGVDQMATRAFVQSDWPRFLIDGGTRGYSWRVSTYPISSKACLGCFAGKTQQHYRDLGSPLACAAGMPGQTLTAAKPMDSYGFVSFFAAAFMTARAIEKSLGMDAAPDHGFSTQAVALNLAGLQHRQEMPSQQCLCRCSNNVVRDYCENKFGGGAP
jgi:hypothetical protein